MIIELRRPVHTHDVLTIYSQAVELYIHGTMNESNLNSEAHCVQVDLSALSSETGLLLK